MPAAWRDGRSRLREMRLMYIFLLVFGWAIYAAAMLYVDHYLHIDSWQVTVAMIICFLGGTFFIQGFLGLINRKKRS